MSHPWSDRLDTTSGDPYAGGRQYPWTGVHSASGLLAQDLTAGDNFLSDLTWTSATNSWGPVEKDRSNGEQNAGDGKPISIRGTSFAKGLGVHAGSDIHYALTSSCSVFNASVGVDDEVGGRGSVIFQVYGLKAGTTTKLYDSGVLTGTGAVKTISNLDITGVTDLDLKVVPGASGIDYDHADWGNARVTCSAPPPSNSPYLSDLSATSATNGWGPVEKDQSNGEQGLNDGKPISIRGTRFGKGLGVHAVSEVHYNLAGNCSAFNASVGVDDEVGGKGSVVFQVYGDGVKLYDSGTLTGTSAVKVISNLSVTGVKDLGLKVVPGASGIDFDHADWAGAQLTCAGQSNQFSYASIPSQPYSVSEAQGEVVGGRLYTFGGFDDLKDCCTPTDRAFVLDLAAGTWSALPAFPDRGVTHAGVTTDGTSIFFAGGYGADADWSGQIFGTPAVWRYDVARQTYARLPDLPVPHAAGQLEVLAGKLHYFGGQNLERTADVGDHFVLDLLNGATAWTTAAPLPHPRNHLGSAVLGGRIYAVGGQTGHDEGLVTQTTLEVYDPATNAWTSLAPLPLARSHISNSTFVLGGRLIVAGGETTHDQPVSDVSAYDPATNTWTSLTPLPEARASGVAGSLGSDFVFTGGNSTASGWRATPSRP